VKPEPERADDLRVDELCVDGEVRHVRGSAGRVVATGGATVSVQGIVSGPVRIDRDSSLRVDGLFSGTVERNDGLLVVAGQANLDLTRPLGRIALAVGSTVVSPGPDGEPEVCTVAEDGSLQPVEKMTLRADVDANRLHHFDCPVCDGRADRSQ
jgi:hypothetical protein